VALVGVTVDQDRVGANDLPQHRGVAAVAERETEGRESGALLPLERLTAGHDEMLPRRERAREREARQRDSVGDEEACQGERGAAGVDDLDPFVVTR
jgi:hypothetical protein